MASEYSNRGAKRARQAREALGFGLVSPLPDLLEAIEGPGGAHVVVLDMGPEVAGAYLRPTPDCPLLFVNGRQPLSRQRFTLAHEFGHHFIGHDPTVDRGRFYSRDPNEIEANNFAADFLMPAHAVARWDAEREQGPVTLEELVQLAARWGVSAQMMRYRVESVLPRRQRDRLDAEIDEGLHLQFGVEPLDDALAAIGERLPRIPPALRDSPLARCLTGDATPEEVAQQSGQSAVAVRRMLGNLGLDALAPAAK